MKLTIHNQLGTTGQDTTVEGSVDDCLKVIDHLDDREDVYHEFDFDGKLEDIRHFSENYLQKLRDEHLVEMNREDERTIIWLCNTNENVLTPLHLSLDGDYSYSTLMDFQKALQEKVDEGTLFL